MRKCLCYVVVLCLFKEITFAALKHPDLSSPTVLIALEALTAYMQFALTQYCDVTPISEIHKFGQGTADVYKVDLADGKIFVFKDARKSEVTNNLVALKKLAGKGNEPLSLEGKAESWGRFVTVTHCFLNGEWYEINDQKCIACLMGVLISLVCKWTGNIMVRQFQPFSLSSQV